MTTDKTITITMSDRSPLRVVRKDWPVIAEATGWDNTHECQANHVWFIRVRQHADGRALVYGEYDEGPGGVYVGFRAARAGSLVSGPDEIIGAIRRVEDLLGVEGLGDECIGDLPAEELE